jgi:hypothetical protein
VQRVRLGLPAHVAHGVEAFAVADADCHLQWLDDAVPMSAFVRCVVNRAARLCSISEWLAL